MENEIQRIFQLPSLRDARSELIIRVNELINTDFNLLITLLYRFDISEKKLKDRLALPHSDAGELIADLIIQRHEEKMLSRKQHRQNDEDIPEDEKW